MSWRNLERELIDLLRKQDAPLLDINGVPHLVNYDMNGQAYARIDIERLAKELDARGIK